MKCGFVLAMFAVAIAACQAQSSACAPCHTSIAKSYSKTGMARSFYRPKTVETGSYYHQPSDIFYEMVQRGSLYLQRQYQKGIDGKPANLRETQVDFILGSGDHVRSFLHRTEKNTLVLLPLAWYAEKGGYWAMNPGYDRPDHQALRRQITYDCMFCHNAYPKIPAEAREPVYSSIPEGIDCQRCHGTGERHISLASKGAKREDIQAAIVNPSRLPADRQMEVCMQCHLETTSSSLPASIVRYERGPFSFQPGEPLSDFILHFDHAPGTGHDDKFEITGSVYRLRKSRCFLKSGGALKCTTCHDPHNSSSAERYTQACRSCHAQTLERAISEGKHTASADCAGCHMPKRRTDDVVHAVMTDHYIQRKNPGYSLADKPEQRQTIESAYRGEVVLYYPPQLPKPKDELYLAIAQVSQGSNLTLGIPRLSAAIEKFHPTDGEYYLQLGDAFSRVGDCGRALPAYEVASKTAMSRMGSCLVTLRQFPRAETTLKQAVELAPGDAAVWLQLGLAQLGQGKTADALNTFQEAKRADPDLVESYNMLGAIDLESGDTVRAEQNLREGIRVEPNFAPIRNNLGNLLSETGRFDEAKFQFEAALRYKENYAGAGYNYALALKRVGRLDEAQTQIEAILRANPNSAEAREFLGNLYGAKGQTEQAIVQYREALRVAPNFDGANLDLGTTLASQGKDKEAAPYLQKAAQSQDADIRKAAENLLKRLSHPR